MIIKFMMIISRFIPFFKLSLLLLIVLEFSHENRKSNYLLAIYIINGFMCFNENLCVLISSDIFDPFECPPSLFRKNIFHNMSIDDQFQGHKYQKRHMIYFGATFIIQYTIIVDTGGNTVLKNGSKISIYLVDKKANKKKMYL